MILEELHIFLSLILASFVLIFNIFNIQYNNASVQNEQTKKRENTITNIKNVCFSLTCITFLYL